MIGLLFQASLNTISSHNGTLNYLFRKPENAPTNLIQDVDPKKSVFTVFLLSKTVVQNFNIEITLTNNKATLVALSYDSAIGVSFEYLRYVIHCDSCKKLSFAPMLKAPQVSLWYCVIDMPKVNYIVMPQFAMIVHTRFFVDQFNLQKSRFLTFKNNTVTSSTIASSSAYQQIGKKVDASYAQKNDRCISCNAANFRTDSSCTCDEKGTMMGGQCYQQFHPTELLTNVDNSQKYFLECNQASRSTVTIEYNITESAAVTYSTFKDGGCSMSKLVLKGYLNVMGDFNNHLYGVTFAAPSLFKDVNISLNITQKGSGMGSSSLCFNEQKSLTTVQTIRITGNLVSEGKSANESFALLFTTTKYYFLVSYIGFYGCKLQVTSDYVGFLIANVIDNNIYCNSIYIAPNIPAQYQIFTTGYIQKASVIDKSFACFGYSSEEQQKALMLGNFFDILKQLDQQWIQSEIIIVDGGASYVGGLIGLIEKQKFSQISQSSIMINIDNNADVEYQKVGLLAGQNSAKFTISQTYVEGNLVSKANNVGLVGYAEYKESFIASIQVAAKVKISGKENVGIFGYINGNKGTVNFNSIFDAVITGSTKYGMFGTLEQMKCNMSIVGKVVDGEGKASMMIANVGENFNLFKVLQEQGPHATVKGSSVNFCSADMHSSIQTIDVTDLTAFQNGNENILYGVECKSTIILKVAIEKELDGMKTVEIMKDDSCTPSNVYIQGSLKITTPDNGIPTQLIIAGYTEFPANDMQFMNFSLNIQHIGNNGTRQVSMVGISPQESFSSANYITISGSILGDSKQDYCPGAYAAFVFATLQSGSITINQLNLFGAQITFSGADAIGIIAYAKKGLYCSFNYLFVTNNTEQNRFMSELDFDRNYYYQDLCARYLTSGRGESLSMQQYQNQVKDGQITQIKLFGKKSHHASIIFGQVQGEGNDIASVIIKYVSIKAQIIAEVEASQIGLAAGTVSGNFNSYTSYFEGQVTARYKAGVIGEALNAVSLSATVKVNITGNQYLGTFGYISKCRANQNLFIEMTITYSQNYIGGVVGYIEISPAFRIYNLVERITIVGNGNPADEIVGYADEVSMKNWYEGSMINKC